MAKNKISEWSTTALSNSFVGGIGILGTDLPENFDNALREIMKQIADLNTGASFIHDTYKIADSDDETKLAKFNAGSITAGQTRTFTFPDKDGTFAIAADVLDRAGAQAMTGDLDMGGNDITDVKSLNGGLMGGFRNKIINGNYDIWQRGTSQTSDGYGSADRWTCRHNGSTKTHSRQTFTLGQTDVPSNPKYYSRTVISSVANTANYVRMDQNIEGVATLAGKTVTLTFYAKADSAKDISIDLVQDFGSGGSPSASVSVIGQDNYSLSTSWQKFTATINLPSISSKTLGSNDDDHLRVRIWFEAGSAYDASTGSLGQQSGTFDIARVSIVEGDATDEDDPFSPRHIQQELALCQRYYNTHPAGSMNIHATQYHTGLNIAEVNFPTTMRSVPTLGLVTVTSGSNTSNVASVSGFTAIFNVSDGSYIDSYTADAEL
jgi:hypothetical protein